mmetsp:Transcript_7348/g.21365  ORF Transcript_7348/g.21365 Transcript_7348/m.21365 type:complete len:572 (-) Transcript_7348:2075-3790(-)|eukprot:CAMPEP_0172360772 /NCGR_PEP_ID=MMETSP1060-20121228/4742_1 /TAXON_ID=37318 /ORGANISM="Pseudo-nitzschia pungens, Strain cf. cingulata" /LENGTH=571 /DNA_ID=CAMNT_0013082853 /DNA_START=111 /DNA_END=1826 /DNA_ORIENTATION=-
MVACKRFFFSIFLASTRTAISASSSYQELEEGQNVKSTGLLRGGRLGNGKKTIVPPGYNSALKDTIKHIRNLSVDGDQEQNAGIEDIKHVMIACMNGEDELLCKERIMNAIPKDSKDNFRLNGYLQLANAYAAEVRGDDSILDGLYGVVDDPKRETMYIKDSVRVHRSLQSTGQSIPYGIDLVKARKVWQKYNTKGENVRICVMDTGVDRDHPDFDYDNILGYDGNTLVQPWFRDHDGHGTHVTGTIAASDNNEGVVGVAPNAEIFTARVFHTNDEFYSSNIITALQACKDGGAQVVSMSLGGFYSVGYEQQAYEDLFTKFGIITVAASGNSGSQEYYYPAAYDYVVSVGSVDSSGDRSSFSTYNDKLDVVAPGSDVLSTWGDGTYAKISGTSMACPHVSGIIALMLSVKSTATPSEIFAALKSTSQNPNTTGNQKDSLMGYGIVNALAAVDAISGDSGETDDDSGDDDDNNGALSCVDIEITLHTDRYPEDTTHWLQVGSEWIFADFEFNSFTTYKQKACIDANLCAEYYILDTFGDGIFGEGVEIKYDGEVVYTGGSFGFGGVRYLGNC